MKKTGFWLYFILLFGSLVLNWHWEQLGYLSFSRVTLILLSSSLLLWLLEKKWHYREDWKPSLRTTAVDIGHSIFSSGGVSSLVSITLFGSITAMGAKLSGNGMIWPLQWPFLLQLALALSIAELGAYWVHRWFHSSKIGWRIHAVHHSATKLHLFAAGRTHPFNSALIFGAQGIVLAFLGAPEAMISALAVFTGINGQLQHCNIPLAPGWLNLFVATSDHHRWHHSSDIQIGNSNYGNNLIIWDRIFGTHYHGEDPVEQVGIHDVKIPENIMSHWILPFTYHNHRDHHGQT